MDVFKVTVPKDDPDFLVQVHKQMDRARNKGYISGRNAQTTPERFKEMLMEGGIIRIPCTANAVASPTVSMATIERRLRRGLDLLLERLEGDLGEMQAPERHITLAREHDSGHMANDLEFLYQKLGHVVALAVQNTPPSLAVANFVVDNYAAITENSQPVMKQLNELTKLLQANPAINEL